MKQMTPFQQTPTHKKQAGNVFFAIFGAIAVVGLLGAGLTTFVGGPLSSSVTLTRESAAQNQMVIGAQTALMGAASQAAAGDCDLDMFVEPMPWRVPGGSPAPVGGGLIPSNIPAPKRDPWGTDYGYCVWDHGPTIDDAACGGAGQNRLIGANGRAYPSLALISAGPDRTFQTTCADFTTADDNSDGDLEDVGDTKLVYKSAGSDDMIFSYTYEEAVAATGDMWILKSSDPNTAMLDKKIEIAGGAEFSGVGDFIGVTADSFSASAADFINLPGIRIPDSSSYGAACTPALAGVLRTNISSVSPPAVVSSATDAQGFRDADSASVTFHSRPIAGNTIIVTVRGYAAGGFALPAANVTDSDGNTYVDIGSTAADPSRVMMFAAYNITGASSALTVTINPTGGIATGVVAALEVSGIDSGSLDIMGANTASNGGVSASGTTATANGLAIGVIGIFGDDNIDSAITHNSGADWAQPIVKDNIPSMAVVTKTFPSAASSVSHTWSYNTSTVTAVRKFMAVFSPVGAASGGGGGSPELSMTVSGAVGGTANITSLGYTDWAFWGTGSLTPSIRKAGGGSLIPNPTLYGGGALSFYGNDPRNIQWTDGTPTVSGTVNDGIFNNGGTGFEIALPADTTQRTAKIFIGHYNTPVRVTSSISDGSSPPQVNTALLSTGGASGNGEITVTYRAASAGQTMTVRWERNGGDNVTLQAVALNGPSGGGGSSGPITLVQQSPDVDSSTSAWVTATFPSDVTAGNTIVVPITTWNGEIYTVYDNLGNTYNKVAESLLNDLSRAYIFAANNVIGGTVNINVTSAGGSNKSIAALEFSGLADDTLELVDQTGAFNTSGGTTATLATSGATDQADELVVGVMAAAYNRTDLNFQTSPPFIATGHVESNGQAEATYSSVYRILSATGTPSHTWTFNPPVDGYDDVVSTMVTLRGQAGQSGGGGGGSPAPTGCEALVNAPPLEGGPGSPGPIAVVQRSAKQVESSWTGTREKVLTFSTPPQAGNSVIVFASQAGTGDRVVVRDNQGNSYTQIMSADPGHSQYKNLIYIADNIKAPVGLFTVFVNKGGDQGGLVTGMMEVAGLEPMNTRDQVGFMAGTGGTGSTVTTNGATSQANELIIATHVGGWNSGLTNLNYGRQGGWSEAFTENNSNLYGGHSSVYRISSSVETPSHTWSYNSLGGDGYGAGIISLKGYTTPPTTPVAASVINQTPYASADNASFVNLPTAGSTILVMIRGWGDASGPFTVAGVSDNQGNTYSLVEGSANNTNFSRNIYLYAAYDISAPSGTFTVTADVTNPDPMSYDTMTITAMEVVGLLSGGADLSHNNFSFASGPTFSITAPGTTAEANEFAVAFFGGEVGNNPGFDVKGDPTWRPISSQISPIHFVSTKEIPAAGTTISQTWNTFGNNAEQAQGLIATFRTDPDFVFTPTTPASSSPSPNAPRMMSSSGGLLDSGSLNVPKPAGTNIGDLLIWIVSIDGPATNPWPYGFTQIEADFIPGPDSHTIGAAWKIADGTEPATFTASSGSYENISFMMRYTGFDTAQPIEVSTSKALSGVLPWALTWPANTGSITTTVDNARVVWASVTDHTGLAPDYPVLHVPPAGFTERADLRSGQYSNLGVADKVFEEAGPTGALNGLATDSWNNAGGGAYSVENGTLAFAIRPGDGGGSSDQPGPIEYIGSDEGRITLMSSRGMVNINVTAPDNIAAGDLIILAQSTDVEVYNGDFSTITWPTGFTEVNEVSGGSQQFNWAWKVADGSEGVMTVSSSDSWSTEVVMSVYRGVDPDDPIGAHSGYLEPADTEFAWPYSVPGITVPNAGSSLVLIPFGDTGFVWGINMGARFFTAPASFVERENRYDNGDAFAPIAIFDSMGVAAGATGNIAGNMINQRMLDPAITGAWAHAGGFLLSLNPDPDPPVVVPEAPTCTSSILQMCDGTQWRSVATSVSGGGINLDPNNNAVCDSTSTSTVRYNTSALRPEYCNGTNWLPFALGEAGVVLVSESPVIASLNSFNNNWSNAEGVSIVNRGSITSGPLSFTLTGPDMAVFDYAGLLAGSTCDDVTGLAPGQSCILAVRARRNTDGPYSANIVINDSTSSVTIPLSGTATGNTVCYPGKLGFGGIIVSCLNSTTPYYVITGSGCGTGTNEPVCTNINGASEPRFTLVDTVAWPVSAYGSLTESNEGDRNTVNLVTYSAGWNAANYCNNLVKDGYTNWYLPSSDEWMKLIAPMRDALLITDSTANYWSSTFSFYSVGSSTPAIDSYNRPGNEINYFSLGIDNSNVRCLRKHGQAMPSAGVDDSIIRWVTNDTEIYASEIYAPLFRTAYSTSLNTQVTGIATTIIGINTTVPISVSGPGSPEFRSRPNAGAWSGYGTSGTIGPGYEVQLRANTPAAAGQENAINVSIGSGNYIWKVRAIQTATRQIFVTSTTYNGNLGGLSGADANCMTRAAAASLGGNWYALLGGRGASAFDRIPWNWNRLDTMAGVQVAANMGDLLDTVANLNPINRDEFNAAATTNNVWTGMVRRDPVYSADDYGNQSCQTGSTRADWTSSSSSVQGRQGQVNNSTNWIDTGAPLNCNQARRLYCVGPF